MRNLVADLAVDHDVTVLSYDPSTPAPDGVRQLTLPPPVYSKAPMMWRVWPLSRARHLARVVPWDELRAADLVVALDCHFAWALRRTPPARLIYLSLTCIPRMEWFAASGVQAGLTFLQFALLERLLANAADAVIVNSAKQGEEMRRFELLPRLRPVVIYPVFPEARRPAPRGSERDTVTIVSVGRLVPVKNLSAVIEMAARLRDLPCRFVIAGQGEEGERLRSEAAARGVGDRVSLPGPVPDLEALLADSDIFLHPSNYEGFAIAVFEAMRAGLPVVCASGRAVTGCAEFATDGVTACFVDFDKPDEAARALRQLVLDRPRREAMARSAQLAAERMLERSYAGKFREVVSALLGSEQGAGDVRPQPAGSF